MVLTIYHRKDIYVTCVCDSEGNLFEDEITERRSELTMDNLLYEIKCQTNKTINVPFASSSQGEV